MALEATELLMFAGGFMALGVVLGVAGSVVELGWIISRCSKPTLEGAVCDAERIVEERARRRHRREERAARVAERRSERRGPVGRHLAR